MTAKAKTIELLTYDEAAETLRISVRSLRRLINRGVFGRSTHAAKSCVFSDEIDAYIEGLAKGNGEAAVRAYRVRQGRIKR